MYGVIEHEQAPLPVIVDIDERSLSQVGQWPWSRHKLSKLLKKIVDVQPASIGVDILLSERDRTSLNQVKKELFSEIGLDLDLGKIPHLLRDNDVYLANTLAQGNFILGYSFLFSGPKSLVGAPIPLNISMLRGKAEATNSMQLYSATGAIEPLPIFYEAAGSTGFVNVRPDFDGVIRRIPIIIKYNNRIYPSFALAAVLKALNIEQTYLRVSGTGQETLWLNTIQIPLDNNGNLLIRYRGGKNAFEYVSAVDLLNDHVEAEKLSGRVVFVGTSATGLKDSYTTPVGSFFPGVEIHANVADNILRNRYLRRPAWSRGIEIVITLITGVAVSLVLAVGSPLIALLLPGIVTFGLWFGVLTLLKTGDIYFSPLYPLLNITCCFGFLSLLRFRMAEKQARKSEVEIHRIESELNVAREIQMGVIPKEFPPFPEQDYFDIYATLVPAREVGGDLYDFFFLDEDHLCFTIGDVSGKGVPASLFMVITMTLVKNLSPFCNSPAELMKRINNILDADNPKTLFVTLFIAILDLKTGQVIYANGGHNPPLVFSGSKGLYFRKGASGPVVGAMADMPYKVLTMTLAPGDGILLYTDGVTEAKDLQGRLFTDDKLLKVCNPIADEPVERVVNTVLQAVRDHAGTASQSDDIAMILLRFNTPKAGY